MVVRLLAWVMVAVTLVACGPFATNDLADTTWQLQMMNSEPVPSSLIVNMDFTADTFGGVGFCNNYGGNYRVNGSTLTLTQTVMTMMACLGDNRDQLEQQHIAALDQVRTYQIQGEVLTLFDQANVPLLQFVRVSK